MPGIAVQDSFATLMNFQGLKHIELPEKYLDTAIKRTKKVVDEKRGQKLRGSPLQKSQTIEIEKLDSIERELRDSLHKILVSYPSLDSLPEFYRELINNTLDVGSIKKSLGAVNWCIKKIQEFTRKYRDAIRRSTEITRINQYRREFYGRISSTLRQIKPNFEYLEESRRTMMDFPTIKTGIPTVAIAGFPNIGKSTLLSKLTPAKPKIANYAFTTTGINLGYSEIKGQKIQFMDIPGTLARFEKQNVIEKIATLALKYVTDAIIYIFDLTETYPLKDQIELYEQLKKTKKPMLVYLSKTDLLAEDKISEFKKKYKAFTNTDDLKKAIEKIDFI